MKLAHIFITLGLTVGINAFGQNNNKTDKKGFAVLELFTSEGCSSCPPADDLMGKIQNEYKDSEVYVLAFHVDYWDNQGWKDIFGNADYTKRQYDYAKWLKKDPIYTPQVVINGKTEYIASQEAVVRGAIAKALSKPATAGLSLKGTQLKNKLTVNYTATGTSKNSILLLAVVQKSAKSNVKRGENAHRVLSHYQIVRSLQKEILDASGKGSAIITLPKGFTAKDFEVIGFIQDLSNGTVLTAEKTVFN